jgi:hypothetical protein
MNARWARDAARHAGGARRPPTALAALGDGTRALGAEAAHWSAKTRFENATAPRYAPDNLRTYLEQGGPVTAKEDSPVPEGLQ